MKPATRALVLSAALACLTPFDAAAQDLTCDPAALDAESYRLTVEETARNVTAPRSSRWAPVGDHLADLDDLNASSIGLAERARRLDDRNLLAHAQLARQYVIDGIDARLADAEWRRVLASGGAIAWTATLYDVDAKSFFIMAFNRQGIRVFRFGEAAPNFPKRLGVPEFPGPEAMNLWRAWGGCVDGLRAEAFVPWSDVREIAAGNYVLWFRFNTPVTVVSDNRHKKTLKEFKVALHGAMGTVDYRQTHDSGKDDRWYEDTRTYTGIGRGPASYQDRIRLVLAAEVDPNGRINLPKQKRGAGW